MESFQIYNEALAADLGMLQYCLVCLNGRFNFLPFEERIQETITEEKREGSESQKEVALNFGELNTKVCGLEFDLEIQQTR